MRKISKTKQTCRLLTKVTTCDYKKSHNDNKLKTIIS